MVETGEKFNEKTIKFIEVIKHNQWDWCAWKCLHRSSIRGLIQITQDEGKFVTILKKDRFWTWWFSILRMQFHTDMLCKSLKSLWMARIRTDWALQSCSYLKMTLILFWKFQLQTYVV